MSFQGGVNHFEDGPETPMEVKIFQVNPKRAAGWLGLEALRGMGTPCAQGIIWLGRLRRIR